MNKCLLVITDGIGCNPKNENNAFFDAKKPHYDYLFANVPFSTIQTSGLGVGLPEGQMGNSEVGHMTLGGGRMFYQDLVKVSKSFNEGTFEQNGAFQNALQAPVAVHLFGLFSDGGVHSHLEHIIQAAKLVAKNGKKAYLHLITDGRDVSPKSAQNFFKSIENDLNENIQIASVSGRFYTMDRDNRWERVQQAYEAIALAKVKTNKDFVDYIEENYDKEITDEFIIPCTFGDYEGFKAGDTGVFLNFRPDRARQISQALGGTQFDKFERSEILKLTTMTSYSKDFNFPVLFKKDIPKNTLAEVLSAKNLRQLHTSETEKYAHVTYFFNGGIESELEGESRILVPSPFVQTYDEKPQMSAKEVADEVIKGVQERYDFIVVNFANGDMVGHTGNHKAAVKAVESVDQQLKRIWEVAKKEDYSIILTSDHGNCEETKNAQGEVLTNHTIYDVWCFVDDARVKRVNAGSLSNIAATVLTLMGVEIPNEMDASLVAF